MVAIVAHQEDVTGGVPRGVIVPGGPVVDGYRSWRHWERRERSEAAEALAVSMRRPSHHAKGALASSG
jgi:hypothetical protein